MNNFQRNIYRLYTEVITPIITCNATAVSGGQGVTEYTIQLDKPLGGIVIMDFNAQTVVDKLEIIHNGVKKATSGMTTANAGPFDDLYGNPTVPTGAQASATDQFIGTSKGAIPTRDSIFLSETGITDIVRTKQQLIWWVYTQTDYELLNNVIVRVTGIYGTAWDLQRLCTDQVPTGVTPPVNGTINIYCNTVYNEGESPSATVEVSVLTGGSGTYQITNTLYLSEAGALGGTYVNAGYSPVNYFLVENNTWWVGIRDTNNPTNKIAKQIVVNCQAACTEYTVGTTSGSGQSYSYIACDGTPSGGTIGGAAGYDADTFCAQTGTVTLLGAELTLVTNSAC